MAEAEGEPEEGKRLVIDTILNRVDFGEFPSTVTEVIYQPEQFSSMWNGRIDDCYVMEEICQLVEEELKCRLNNEVMFFTAGGYGKFGVPMFQVGNHYFQVIDRKEIRIMVNFMGFTFSAFAGICFVSGLAILISGKEY